MYLSDSEDEEFIVVFKKTSKVSFDESKNQVYYIASDTYWATSSTGGSSTISSTTGSSFKINSLKSISSVSN